MEWDTEVNEKHSENIVLDDSVPDVIFVTNEKRHQIFYLTYDNKYIVRGKQSMSIVFRSPSICWDSTSNSIFWENLFINLSFCLYTKSYNHFENLNHENININRN